MSEPDLIIRRQLDAIGDEFEAAWTGWFAFVANSTRIDAEKAREIADDKTAKVTTEKANVERERDRANTNEGLAKSEAKRATRESIAARAAEDKSQTEFTQVKGESIMTEKMQSINRRTFLGATLAGAIGGTVSKGSRARSGKPVSSRSALPVSGMINADDKEIEDTLLDLLADGDVRAAQLCVSKDGEIILNRAYGWADQARGIELPTNARIRLASVDKVITSTGIDWLCKNETLIPGTDVRFSLDMKPFEWFATLGLTKKIKLADPRIFDATVKDLLDHQVGLDQNVHDALKLMELLRLRRLPVPEDAIRYMFATPLDRAIGTGSVYNSAGYLTLRFLIEKLTDGFVPFLKSKIFEPAGTSDVCLSRAKPSDRDPLEVRYQCANRLPSIFPKDRGALIPEIDGGGGRYIDYHLVLATSAEACVRYVNHWFFGTADRLWNERPSLLAQGLNNGAGVFNGGMCGIRTTLVQRRWSMCNFCVLTNWVADAVPEPRDFAGELIKVIEKRGW